MYIYTAVRDVPPPPPFFDFFSLFRNMKMLDIVGSIQSLSFTLQFEFKVLDIFIIIIHFKILNTYM